ncbi:MarR family winged helix-turn-helix transcriptional regulator [Elongatibacter sediminis]|uniref:Winged helix-turn-helix transcriptional regulator n=1 Tax=Elongatibacter sediminis TaxID=3119006 RepID=A0AAW9R7T9_9GAMM
MNNNNDLKKAVDAMSERTVTELFSCAFSQPLKLLGQNDASLSSYAVFWCVAENQGITQVEVSRRTGLSAKTVSRVISLLGENDDGRGWIRQDTDPADRRVRRLTLSRRGRNVHRKLLEDVRNLGKALG